MALVKILRLTFILFFLLTGFSLVAQNQFQTKLTNEYNGTFNSSPFKLIRNAACYNATTIHGSYYMAGMDDWVSYITPTSGTTFTIIGGHFGAISKISSSGVKQYSKVSTSLRYINKIKPTSDGKLIIGARSNEGCWTVCHVGEAVLAKIDTNGNILWSKGYNGTNYFGASLGRTDEFLDVYECSDKGFIAVGSTEDSAHKDHALITRVDSSGNVLWSYASAYNGWSIRATSVIQLKGSSNFFVLINGKLLKLNSNGNVISSPNGIYGSHMLQLPNGKIFIGTNQLSYSGSNNYSKPVIMQIDTNGTILWRKKYTAPSNYCRMSTMAARNDGTILVGTTSNNGVFTNGNNTNRNIIFNINAGGTVLWATESHYNGFVACSYDRLSTFEANDGKLIVAGEYALYPTAQSSYTGTYSIITKTDSTGSNLCLNTATNMLTDSFYTGGSSSIAISLLPVTMYNFNFVFFSHTQTKDSTSCGINTTLFTPEVNNNSSNDLIIYPNPSTGKFNLSYWGSSGYSLLEIFDITGKIVFSKPLNETSTEFTEEFLLELPQGVYAVVLSSSKNRVNRLLSVSK